MAGRATGRDESFCLDVVQEAMLRVIKSMPKSIASDDELRAWLSRVVRTCAMDMLRGERRRRKREAVHGESIGNSVMDGALDEQIAWLQGELEAQGGEVAAMLRLRHALGWTLSRIGRVFGASPSAVDGRMNRAIASMRERAQEQFNES